MVGAAGRGCGFAQAGRSQGGVGPRAIARPGQKALQWSRGPTTAEHWVLVTSTVDPAENFNGAAGVGPRNTRTPPAAAWTRTSLQWSRGRRTAEHGLQPRLDQDLRATSMRPRS
jgi:hypothetical protein